LIVSILFAPWVMFFPSAGAVFPPCRDTSAPVGLR
jgi:hypothetical protein